MTTDNRATVAIGTNQSLAIWINRSLEALWILTIVLVPLAFLGRSYGEWSTIIGSYELPKITILRTSAGLMAILWLLEWAVRPEFQKGAGVKSLLHVARPALRPSKLVRWLNARPSRWLILAVVLYFVSTLLSTALSTSSGVSLWGDVPGQDSYSAYTVASYGLIFAVIATHLKTEAQLWRLLGAIALMGVLVGAHAVAQHYGHDFFDLIEPLGHTRSTSTFGRTIFAGSILLMTISVTTVAATRYLTPKMSATGFALGSSAWATVLGAQILGTIFIVSRGPWLGTLVSLAALFGIGALFGLWRPLSRASLVLFLGAGLALAVSLSPLQSVADKAAERSHPQLGNLPSLGAAEVTDRFTSIGSQVAGGGLSGRKEIWGNSWELVTERPWFGFTQLSLSFLRPVIGYGPEQFRTTYLLVSPPNPAANLIPNEAAHAHNFFLHQGVETGILGLFTAAGLFLAVFGSGAYIWLRQRSALSGVHKLVLAGILATIVGRLVEQMVGVARVSDLMVFWMLLAVFAALPVIFASSGATEPAISGPNQERRASISRSGPRRGPLSRRLLPLRLLAVAGLFVGIALLTWTKNIDYVRSALKVDQAAAEFRLGRLDAALSSISNSIELSPDVSNYYGRWSAVYWAHPSGNPIPHCGAPQETPPHRLCLAQSGYDLNNQWVTERPYDFRARLALADSAVDLGALNGDPDLRIQAARLYLEAAEMVPNSWELWNRAGEVLIGLDQPEAALDALAKSLAIIESSPLHAARSLKLQGVAYRQLEQYENSLRSLDQALLSNPDFELAYLERSQVYFELGQADRAIQDLNEALRLDPDSAETFYRRGTVYYRIGNWNAAVADLTKVIDLNPQHAKAFNNRGLAYARLDSLEAASRNFERAIGLDPDSAIAHNNLGFVLRDLGHLDRAIDELDRAISLDPTLTIAYYNRALAFTLLGRDSEARRDGQRAVEMGFDALSMNAAIDEFRERR